MLEWTQNNKVFILLINFTVVKIPSAYKSQEISTIWSDEFIIYWIFETS